MPSSQNTIRPTSPISQEYELAPLLYQDEISTISSFIAAPARHRSTLRETLPAILFASFVSFGGLLYGYDSGVISGIIEMEAFNRQFGTYWTNIPSNIVTSVNPAKPGWALTTTAKSLVVSILSLGTFLGCLCAAPAADSMGRRWGMQLALFIFSVGVMIQCTANTVSLFCLGRVFAGFGVGIISVIVPLYQSESSPAWLRGAIVTSYQWAITIGLFFASIVDRSTQHRSDSTAYLIPVAVQFILAGILSLGLIALPESPRWLVKRGRTKEAAKTIAFLNPCTIDDDNVQQQVKTLEDKLQKELKTGSGTYLECFQRNEQKNLTRILTGMVLQALQQLSGINFIFYYGTTYFASTGAKDPFAFTIISNSVNVLCTLPGMFLMDRIGRRTVFLGGAAWMCVSQLLVAILGSYQATTNEALQSATIAFVCMYIAGFAATWGPAAWLYTSETFPLTIRAKGISMTTASNWLCNFTIGYSTPYLVDSGSGHLGLGPRVFYLWSFFCFLAILFSYFCINETMGLSLEEVDELYTNSTTLKSTAYNARLKRARQGTIKCSEQARTSSSA